MTRTQKYGDLGTAAEERERLEAAFRREDEVQRELDLALLKHKAMTSDRDRFRDHAAALHEALEWVSDRYGHTLGGRPVRDADEALLRAELALKAYRRSVG